MPNSPAEISIERCPIFNCVSGLIGAPTGRMYVCFAQSGVPKTFAFAATNTRSASPMAW